MANEFKELDLQIAKLEKAMRAIGELKDEGLDQADWENGTTNALISVRQAWTTLKYRRESMAF